MFSFDRICSLSAPFTGRSKPLGLKSILKVITLIARSAPFVTKSKFGRGEYDALEDRDSVYQRKEFVEEEASRFLFVSRSGRRLSIQIQVTE